VEEANLMNREVLLIEDDAPFRMSIVRLFEGESYRFFEASSPEEGIEILGVSPQIRVILLDLSFPGAPGTAVLDHIKDRSGDYRVIVLTAHDEMLRAERAGEYDVFNYLPKAERSTNQAIRFTIDQAFRDLERQLLDQKNRFLLEVQKRISHNSQLNETLDLICQSVRTTVGAYTCHIRVYDFALGDYHLAGFAAAAENLRHAFDQPKAKGDLFSGRVVEGREPEVFDDLQSMEDFQRFKKLALERSGVPPDEKIYFRTVRSAYIVPISTGLFGNQVDAVLNVSSDLVGFFDARARSLVRDFVDQAALAVTKNWLQRKREEVHQDYRRISVMLTEISDLLRGTDSLRKVYEVVLQRISDIVTPEVISVFRFNETTGLVENVAELGGNQPAEEPEERYRPGQSLTGSVFESQETIHLPCPGDSTPIKPLEDKRYDQENKEGYLRRIPSGNLEHYLGVPIRIGGKVRGVLRAMNKKSQYYGESDYNNGEPAVNYSRCLLARGFSLDCRHVLEITASHLAVAIRNAELFDQVHTLSEVGRLISSEMNIDEVLKLTIKKMAEMMQAQICMLFLREGDDRIALSQCFGMPVIEASYSLGEGATGRVFATGEAKLIGIADQNDGKYDLDIRKFLPAKHGKLGNIESLMIVPIIAKGTTLGVMKVINKVGDHLEYSSSDLEYLLTFAGYVGIAIENARIYKLTNDRLAVAERNAALALLVKAVAHQINNTSGCIPANVAAILAELKSPNERVKRMLALIERVANRATAFANELAGFWDTETEEKQDLDVNEVIRSAIEELQFDLPKYRKSGSIRLEVSLCEHPLVCAVFANAFAEIVENIVVNGFQALEYTQNGVVRVSSSEGVSESGSNAILRFEDNGPGITPKNIEKIFDPGFTTKLKRGYGLGLWLARTKVEQIGGTIEVESEPGRGAKFVVKVPLVGG
jgi:GAF domain-containing protein/ActR/RegA family two-component response regulator